MTVGGRVTEEKMGRKGEEEEWWETWNEIVLVKELLLSLTVALQ